MTEIPFDLTRYGLCLGEIEAELERLKDAPISQDEHHWFRQHYALALASFNMMPVKQQLEVSERLDAIRARLEKLAH